MKELRILVVVFLAAAVSGCSSFQSTPTAVDYEGRQETAILTLMAAWNGGPVDVVEQYGADTVIFHYGGKTMTTTFAELKGLIAHWLEAFPDFRMHVDEIITEGNVTAVRMRYEGSQRGMVWHRANRQTSSRRRDDVLPIRRRHVG